MSHPRASRCGIGRSSSAAGTTIESMHHGLRPEYSHVTLHRAARWRRGNEPHCRWQCRSRALHAEIRVGLPAPAKDSACPDKPRNPDERFSAHGDVCLPASRDGAPLPEACFFLQITRNAMIIMLRRPTATIVLVVISISVSFTGIGPPAGAWRHAPRSGHPVSRSRCSKGRGLPRRGGCRSARCRCLPAACRRGDGALLPPGCDASA